MKGRPKIGEVWVARSQKSIENDHWWNYEIVAVSRETIIGVKDNGEGRIWATIFSADGHDVLDALDEHSHFLTRRSRAKPFLQAW